MVSIPIRLACLAFVLTATPILAQWEADSAISDGTLVKTDHPAAVEYMLIVEYGRPYQGKQFDRISLAVSKADGTIHVMERSKPSAKN